MRKGFFVKAIAYCLVLAITLGSVTPSFAAEMTVSEGTEQLSAPGVKFNHSEYSVELQNTAAVAANIMTGLVPTDTSGTPVSDEYVGVSFEVGAGESEVLTLSDLNEELLQGKELAAGEYRLFAYAEETGDYLRSEITIKSLPRVIVEQEFITDPLNVVYEEGSEYLYFDELAADTHKGVVVHYVADSVEKWCMAKEVDGKIAMEAALIENAGAWSVKGVDCFDYTCSAIKSTFNWVSYTNIVIPGTEPEPVADLTMEVVEDSYGRVFWKLTNHTDEPKDIGYGFVTEEQIANGNVQKHYGTTIEAGDSREYNAESLALHYPTTPGTYYFAVYEDSSDEIIAATECPIDVEVNFDIESIIVNKNSNDEIYFENISASDYDVCRVDFWLTNDSGQSWWQDCWNQDGTYFYMSENVRDYLETLIDWEFRYVLLSSMDYSVNGIDIDVSYVEDFSYAYDKDHECAVANEIVKLATFDKDGSYTTTCSCGKTIDSRTLYRVSDVYLEETSYTYSGMYYTPNVVVKDSQGNSLTLNEDYRIEYFNNASAGTATAKVRLMGDFYDGIKELNFTINPYTLTESFEIREIASQAYTGSAIKPEVIVAYGDFCLIEGTDYTVSYSNNTEIGNASVTVTGKGNYSGTLTASFKIVGKKLLDSMVQNIANVDYTGREMKPEVTVMDGTVKLTEGTDYTVTYTNNKNHGTATAIITGCGEYSGTVTRLFKIVPVELQGNVLSNKYPVKVYTGKPVTLESSDIYMWCPSAEEVIPLEMGKDYQIIGYLDNTDITEEAYAILEGIGNFKGTFHYKFKIKTAWISEDMIFDIPEEVYTGEEIKPDVYLRHGGRNLVLGQDYKVSYKDNVDAGTATVIIEGINNYEKTVETTFEIVPLALQSAMVSAISNEEYIGTQIQPEVTVKHGTKILAINRDYKLNYKNNINAGTATVEVTGYGNYTGTVQALFEIVPQDFVPAMIFEIPNQEYTGSEIKPEVSMTDGRTNLVLGKDYTVTYKNNIAAGTATAVVTGINNYTGTVSKTFVIDKADLYETEIAYLAEKVYTGEAVKLSEEDLILKWHDKELKLGVDFKFNKYFENTKATNDARVSLTAMGNFKGTKVFAFVIKPKTLTAEMVADIANREYTGNTIKPKVTVKDGRTTLVKDTDYTVTYENNTEVGIAKAIIKGTKNYTGIVEKAFTIGEGVLDKDMIQSIAAQTYTGKEITPELKIVFGDITLEKDKDYTVVYSNNVNAGTATVAVTGIGSYAGTVTTSFAIKQKEIESSFISNTLTEPEYTGKAQEPEVILKDASAGQTLELNKDYTLTYSNNVNAGQGKVLVKGIGNYNGSFTIIFNIKKTSLAEYQATVEEKVYYTGSALKPAVTVTDGNKELVKDKDYTATYSSNTKLGTATVQITGKGNYEGVIYRTFVIAPRAVTLSSASAPKTYAGQISAKWVPDSLADGYLLQYAEDESFENAVDQWIENKADKSITLTGLEEGKTYYVRIAAYKTINNEKVLGKFSSVKNATAKISFDVSLEDVVTYTGKSLNAGLTVTADGNALKLDKDYTVVYSNNKNPGKATITVNGIGKYAGVVNKNFIIIPKAMTFSSAESSASDPGKMLLKWKKDSNVTGYVICYSANEDFTDAKAITLDKNTYTEYELTEGLKEDATYYVKIAAYKTIDGQQYFGDYSIAKAVTLKKVFTVDTIENTVYTGKSQTPSVVVMDEDTPLTKDVDYKVSYSNNVKPGLATVKVTGIGEYVGTVSNTFIIVPKTLTLSSVTASTSDSEEMLVKWKKDSLATGYVIQYSVNEDFADAKEIILGKNTYTQYEVTEGLEANTTYYVRAAAFKTVDGNNNFGDYSAVKAVTLKKVFTVKAIESAVYTGKSLVPSVTVMDGDKLLTKGADYKVSCSDNVKPGLATVKVTGIGEYAGVVTNTFIIYPKAVTKVTVTASTTTPGSMTVKWAKNSSCKGYILEYSKDADFETVESVEITKNTTVSKTITDLEQGVLYYVRVAAYATENESRYVGEYSSVGSAVIKKAFTVEAIDKQVYTGKSLKPSAVVKCVGEELVKDVDYTVSYSGNVKPGKATVTVKGIGAYAGTVKATFVILPKQGKLNSLKSLTEGFTASWTKDANATGYSLQYSTDETFSTDVNTVDITNKSTVSKKITSLVKGETYYVRIASYKTVDGTKQFGDYSVVMSVKTK